MDFLFADKFILKCTTYLLWQVIIYVTHHYVVVSDAYAHVSETRNDNISVEYFGLKL